MIAPSDEDSFTFTVSAANGDIFKLRGKYTTEVNIHLSRSSASYFFIICDTPYTCTSAQKGYKFVPAG